MNIIIGILAIIGISYVIYLLMAYLMLPNRIMQIGPDSLSLSTKTQVITNQQLRVSWTSTSGSTLQFYINPSINDKSGVSGNEYASVVEISSRQLFQILVSPDAGRGLSMAPAQLKVFTMGRNNAVNSTPEIIEIPSFPLQRWTCVAIVKQGRKFIIYLNGKAVVSHMCKAMPHFDVTPLNIGDPRLGGTISQMSLAPYALSPTEIRNSYRSNVDTSGKPIQQITLVGIFGPYMPIIPSGWWCPDGNCSPSQDISPLEKWSSPYG